MSPVRASPAARWALALLAVLLVVSTGWLAWRRDGSSVAAPTASGVPTASASASSRAGEDARQGLDAILAARGQALLDGDRAAWLATVDQSQAEVVARQGVLFDNIQAVPLDVARFDYSGRGPSLPAAQQLRLGADAWVAKVVFSYRISGADQSDVRHEQYLTMAQSSQGWVVAGTDDGPAEGVQRDLWDLTAVTVHRGQRSMLIAADGVDAGEVQRYAAGVDTAAAAVDEVWGRQWPRTVVVLVPSTQTQMAQLLGRPDELGLDQIAAVTTGEVGRPVGELADRVIVNPRGFAQLDAAGEQVVLTHEVTHVATRAAGPGTVTTWFSEGFADYVAYQNTGFTLHQVAGDVLGPVAQGEQPPGLPTRTDFDASTNTSVAGAYSRSYLAVEYLARAYSADAVLELYHAQAGSAGAAGQATTPVPLAQAMPQVIGVDEATFERDWQAFVEEVAADPSQ
ncbi:MAG: hypothetical protein ACK5MT_12105 [Actinomycetales bacterium]